MDSLVDYTDVVEAIHPLLFPIPMKTVKQFAPAVCLGILLLSSCSDMGSKAQLTQMPAIDFEAMDTTVRAQDDFYHYVNGGWIKSNPLKPAYSRYGTFDILRDTASERVHQIIESLAHEPQTKGSNEYRIATLYNQAMDSATRNGLGAKPIEPHLRQVEALKTKADLLAYAAENDQVYGEGVFFNTYVAADDKNSTMNILHFHQTSLALGAKDYYTDESPETKAILEGYVAYLERILALAGYTEADAKRIAANTLRVEREIAQISYSQTELRDSERNYNICSIDEITRLSPGFDWRGYFTARGLSVKQANFGQLDFFKAFGRWFAATPVELIRDYLLASTVSGAATALSDDFTQANFDFFGKQLSGRKEMHPRWKRSVGLVSSLMGEAIGQVYVQHYFSPAAKERMLTLVKNLQIALGQRVESLEWMSPETKAKALEKLQNFTVKIGYPDEWKDYSGLDIDAERSYYDNLLSATRFVQADNLKDLGQPVDRKRWLMNPQDVNAYYMPTTNEICFPAGILQPPFFNVDADDAVNYGAIGVVIGHEMTHGFDDQGSNFDKDGNMHNWWSPEDKTKFQASTRRLVEQFARNEVAPGTFANGELTLGENIADQGGLTVAHLALQLALKGANAPEQIDGLTQDQRFFIAYARLWGQNISQQEILRLTKIDPHSLGLLRVNQALKNISAFVKAFDLKEGDGMYIAPEERIEVW